MENGIQLKILSEQESIIKNATSKDFNLGIENYEIYDASITVNIDWFYKTHWVYNNYKGNLNNKAKHFGKNISAYQSEHSAIIEDVSKNKILHEKHIAQWQHLREESFIRSDQPHFIQNLGSISYAYNCSNCSALGHIRCNSCNGSGQNSCYGCGGSGQRSYTRPVADPQVYGGTRLETYQLGCGFCNSTGKESCKNCGASGRIQCNKCGGFGELTEVADYEVKAHAIKSVIVKSENEAIIELLESFIMNTSVKTIFESLQFTFSDNYSSNIYSCSYLASCKVIRIETFLETNSSNREYFISISYHDKNITSIKKPYYFDYILSNELSELKRINQAGGEERNSLIVDFFNQTANIPIVSQSLKRLVKSNRKETSTNFVFDANGYVSKKFSVNFVEKLNDITDRSYLKYNFNIFLLGTISSIILIIILIDILANYFLNDLSSTEYFLKPIFISWVISASAVGLFCILLLFVTLISFLSTSMKSKKIPEEYRKKTENIEVYSSILHYIPWYFVISLIATFLSTTQLSPFYNYISQPIVQHLAYLEETKNANYLSIISIERMKNKEDKKLEDRNSYKDREITVDQIAIVQNRLNESGYNLNIDGVMGETTRNAIIQWLKERDVDLTDTSNENLIYEHYKEYFLPEFIEDMDKRLSNH